MEKTLDELGQHALQLLKNAPTNQRVLIAVSGIPGSGKTTLGTAVYDKINEIWSQNSSTQISAFLPMDGFHLTRETLASLPNAEEAIAKRGAPFTFDADGLTKLIQRLREPVTKHTVPIYAPSFDHAIKDPIENDVVILPTDRILIIEGNYLHLQDEPWNKIASLMDELWFVQVERDVARNRLIRRHLEAGIAGNEIEAAERAEKNDLVNGDYILSHSLPSHINIVNIHDDRMA
ncbi:P-loop containing nucleoside triphosphate hydrolase protein [Lipomyces japonicus]|uniref:P-loop containing nucleoside triphosphate hydrolase protein n=1 Tax=Lipomyces japonicus TaxID=56871 RepID=UPI0034CED84F